MTTIISESFSNNASVSMDMDKDADELYVFYFQATGEGEGKNVTTKKYSLTSYDMGQALAYYEECCATELTRMNESE